jgi:hypothetical protein
MSVLQVRIKSPYKRDLFFCDRIKANESNYFYLNLHENKMSATITRRLAVLPAAINRGLATQAPRTFTTGFAAQKSATETVKDGLKGVDRAVSDKLVDGINIGCEFFFFGLLPIPIIASSHPSLV